MSNAMPTPMAAAHESGAYSGPSQARSGLYLRVLIWSFTLCNTARVISYVPTMFAIQVNWDSSQHSLWTWCTWLGANITMAAWLYEKEGRRLTAATLVSIGNAAMCAATLTLIVSVRL
jgi:hypothetical protein